jgi:hypothetical protein
LRYLALVTKTRKIFYAFKSLICPHDFYRQLVEQLNAHQPATEMLEKNNKISVLKIFQTN